MVLTPDALLEAGAAYVVHLVPDGDRGGGGVPLLLLAVPEEPGADDALVSLLAEHLLPPDDGRGGAPLAALFAESPGPGSTRAAAAVALLAGPDALLGRVPTGPAAAWPAGRVRALARRMLAALASDDDDNEGGALRGPRAAAWVALHRDLLDLAGDDDDDPSAGVDDDGATLASLGALYRAAVFAGDSPELPLVPRLRAIVSTQDRLRVRLARLQTAMRRFVEVRTAERLARAAAAHAGAAAVAVVYCGGDADLVDGVARGLAGGPDPRGWRVAGRHAHDGRKRDKKG